MVKGGFRKAFKRVGLEKKNTNMKDFKSKVILALCSFCFGSFLAFSPNFAVSSGLEGGKIHCDSSAHNDEDYTYTKCSTCQSVEGQGYDAGQCRV
jgi:hypothetical protein